MEATSHRQQQPERMAVEVTEGETRTEGGKLTYALEELMGWVSSVDSCFSVWTR